MIRSCSNCNNGQTCAGSAHLTRFSCWAPADDLVPESVSERASLEILRRAGCEKSALLQELEKIQVSERLFHRWLSTPGFPGSYFLREMALAGYDIDYILTGVRREGNTK